MFPFSQMVMIGSINPKMKKYFYYGLGFLLLVCVASLLAWRYPGRPTVYEGDVYHEMAVAAYEDAVDVIGDTGLSSYMRSVIEKRCPVYQPNGAVWRDCLWQLRDESKAAYRGADAANIEARCQANGDKFDGLAAGEVVLSCEAYNFSK